MRAGDRHLKFYKTRDNLARCGAKAVRVPVEDDGPGFSRIPKGSGMGLALTRRALETVGGALSVGLHSRAGGARAAISLPLLMVGSGCCDEPVRAG
ncbi:hypothetical protein SAMN05661080_04785 [Modestobacter sp. DSM 44400]|uniref:hypothetical protein n=1 Tax=Modestobacter sp. DSM 44400 TaxID=1550230 RepID=UPI000894B9AA|nr:hypothetical protein [Modestobacter sp. DSM 44400]SDY84579.1 hypothetical protein SAMN05661080_04785 [Modestobacter sp. DSM 44400]